MKQNCSWELLIQLRQPMYEAKLQWELLIQLRQPTYEAKLQLGITYRPTIQTEIYLSKTLKKAGIGIIYALMYNVCFM